MKAFQPPQEHRTWEHDGYTFTELIRQEYANYDFSAGMVEGHEVDAMYLLLRRDGEQTFCVFLRPDEVAAINWCLAWLLFVDLEGGTPVS